MAKKRSNCRLPIWDPWDLQLIIDALVETWRSQYANYDNPRLPRFIKGLNILIYRNYRAELEGRRRPFLIKDLDNNINVILHRRHNNFKKWIFLEYIHSKSYFADHQVYQKTFYDEETHQEEILTDVACEMPQPENLDEKPSGFSQSPEACCIHMQTVRDSEKAIKALKSNKKVKNREKYVKLITHYKINSQKGTKKGDEQEAASICLGINRRGLSQDKFKARTQLVKHFSKDYDFKFAKTSAEERVEKAENIQKRSDREMYASSSINMDSEDKEPKTLRQGKESFSINEQEQMVDDNNQIFLQAMQQGYLGCFDPRRCPSNPVFCPCELMLEILKKSNLDKLKKGQLLGHPELAPRRGAHPKFKSLKNRGSIPTKRGPKYRK